ncbi:hypothetical protein [Leuconostoc mesenteroides]|uniref:hypothetical protein n=1 Tax=Leuconostoc mesenteroides TaxID=1245 RepID=UPI00235F7796|nr:hypothetical protein [Leuconostoc mesenteroides]
MDFDKATNILNTLNDKRREINKLLDFENKTIDRDWYFVEIERVRLEFSKSEVDQILDEKKRSLECEIRGLAKELSEVSND